MIKSVTVTNYRGDSIKLELTRPEKSGFAISKIEGLGPGTATINTTELSTGDGAYFNSSRVPARNITLSLIYWGQDNIEDIRQMSYKYFPLKKMVTLQIETDNRVSEIDGYVESNEPDIFSEQESADISIICPNPFFYSSYGGQTTSFSSIEPMFEFPFSNESLTEPLLEMSVLRDSYDRTLVYEGDYEIGVTIIIRASGVATDITIYNIGTREEMKIFTDTIEAITGSGLDEGDEIRICTERGNKSAILIRNGLTTNILNAVDKYADWFQITKGANIFAYTAVTGANNIEIEIQNRIIYEGV